MVDLGGQTLSLLTFRKVKYLSYPKTLRIQVLLMEEILHHLNMYETL